MMSEILLWWQLLRCNGDDDDDDVVVDTVLLWSCVVSGDNNNSNTLHAMAAVPRHGSTITCVCVCVLGIVVSKVLSWLPEHRVAVASRQHPYRTEGRVFIWICTSSHTICSTDSMLIISPIIWTCFVKISIYAGYLNDTRKWGDYI